MTQTESLEAAIASRTEDPKNFKKLLVDQVRAVGGTNSINTCLGRSYSITLGCGITF